MSTLADVQRQHIIELLENGQPLPRDYQHLLFPPERREYELVYADKEREEDIVAETMPIPLQPIRSFGADVVDQPNMLIFGDNLQILRSLLKDPKIAGNVKLVYIDPPFATKQDFKKTERAYQDKVAGAQFIEFIRKRLVLLRDLLAPDGSIFIHLDWRKVHYLKVILDEVFGEQNFRSEIILPGRASKNLQQQFSTITRLNVRHDTLLWYSRTSDTRFAPLWIDKHNTGNPEGHWHSFWSTADRPTMRYPLFGFTPDSGQWTWKEERALQAVDNYERYLEENGGRTLAEYWRDVGGKIEFIRRSPDDGSPQYWRAPSEIRLADTVWSGIPIYSSTTKYPTEKNEALLAQVIEMVTKKGDLILDAFAGSGTTLAVAEKLERRWIGADCGKLSIYTIQKRLLNLKSDIGNQGEPLAPKAFTLYNAGLYDFSHLRQLPWEDWRFFALNLFECRDEPHVVGGISIDGYRGAYDALVFNHLLGGGAVLDYEFIDDLHAQIGHRLDAQFFIIAPAASVTFLEDYVDLGDTRYYILRIPYSIINELHHRDFEAIVQPVDEQHVNAIVDAVGFDFINAPKVACTYEVRPRKGGLFNEAIITINTFESKALAKDAATKANRETLSMVLVDFDYPHDKNRQGKVASPPFELDAVYYANSIKGDDWEVRLPLEDVGSIVMLIFVDIYGNEYTEVKALSEFTVLDIASAGVEPEPKQDESEHVQSLEETDA